MRPRLALTARPGLYCLCGLVTILLSAARLFAQQAVLRGVVRDSTGGPIAEATVAVVAVHQAARTDDRGRFTLGRLPDSTFDLMVRRLGYEPRTITLKLSGRGNDTVSIVLSELPEVMSAVNVSAGERHRRQGIEDFYFRRAQGLGIFFTHDDILKQRASTASDLLRNTPGVRFVRVANGRGVRFSSLANARRNDCVPDLFLDGQRAQGMELDDVSLIDIEAIELYERLATLPGQFAPGNKAPCGAIVIWTRIPGT